MATGVWPGDGIRTADRAWRWAAFLVVIADLALTAFEIRHYRAAYDDCGLDRHACRQGVTHHLDGSHTWMVIAAVPLIVALFLPLKQRTTPWRIACVAVLALCFLARLILMAST
ncbi:hypothetical protein GCM10018793_45970 [Streptomyces sulfonofaciens]|uniref:Uncharacterized protein n=1 Tax=Streptomyces sulfonofaciens TaxID=68272 RepID=A0A919GGJ6_9ACTN|nr:hypothetical protein [Streptomyces sulfonofaciens]GHH83566.1 hypothetical protein GCM10018793_45970 [Streptomyces sulfonofaciens]